MINRMSGLLNNTPISLKGCQMYHAFSECTTKYARYRLNTNIGDTRGKIAILLEARRRFDVNCLLPQCFRSLEEKALL